MAEGNEAPQAPARKGPVDTGQHQADIAIRVAESAPSPAPASTPSAAPAAAAIAPPNHSGGDGGASAGQAGSQPTPDDEEDHLDGLPKGVQKRLAKLTRRNYEYADTIHRQGEQLSALQAELQAMRTGAPAPSAPASPAPAASPGKPTLDQFSGDVEAYTEALSDWKFTQRTQEQQALQQQQQQRHQEQQRVGTHKQREASFAESTPDYYDKAYTAPIHYTPAMLEYVTESEAGPQLAYYLADNLDEARQLSTLAPVAQVRHLAKLEARLQGSGSSATASSGTTATPVRKVTQAPPPPSTVRPAAAAITDASDPGKTSEERIREWQRQQRQRRGYGLKPR